MEFVGDFETHVTLRMDDLVRLDALHAWAKSRNLKFHHLLLDRGFTPSQPMITRQGQGNLAGELAAASELTIWLERDGYSVARVKIEASPYNLGVPVTDGDAAHSPNLYFEHHVKLLVDQDADTRPLTVLAARFAARLSHNARRVREDGRAERFATQRCYSTGKVGASLRLDALLAALAVEGYQVLSADQEYVVHDTAPGVDSGWLDNRNSL